MSLFRRFRKNRHFIPVPHSNPPPRSPVLSSAWEGRCRDESGFTVPMQAAIPEVTEIKGGARIKVANSTEVEGQETPAVMAELLVLSLQIDTTPYEACNRKAAQNYGPADTVRQCQHARCADFRTGRLGGDFCPPIQRSTRLAIRSVDTCYSR